VERSLQTFVVSTHHEAHEVSWTRQYMARPKMQPFDEIYIYPIIFATCARSSLPSYILAFEPLSQRTAGFAFALVIRVRPLVGPAKCFPNPIKKSCAAGWCRQQCLLGMRLVGKPLSVRLARRDFRYGFGVVHYQTGN
jgi:hypothetical protein